MPITPELISLGMGAISGFVLKFWAQAAADRQQVVELLLKKAEFDNKAKNDAAQRATGKSGELTRRLIIIAVLFGVILAPFILTLLQYPTVVEVVTPVKSFLGLFKWGGNSVFYNLYGYLITPEIRQALLALVGFYFGVSAGKRTNL